VNGFSRSTDLGRTQLKIQQQAVLRLQLVDAVAYLDKVKLQFDTAASTVYSEFLGILKEFKAKQYVTYSASQLGIFYT